SIFYHYSVLSLLCSWLPVQIRRITMRAETMKQIQMAAIMGSRLKSLLLMLFLQTQLNRICMKSSRSWLKINRMEEEQWKYIQMDNLVGKEKWWKVRKQEIYKYLLHQWVYWKTFQMRKSCMISHLYVKIE